MTLRNNISLKAYNTLHLSGRAQAFCEVANAAELEAALAQAAHNSLAVLPWGEGSNIVLAGDIDAVVLKMAMTGIQVLEDTADAVLLRVAAGENWHAFVHATLQQSTYGLENLALIPGTVGAAPVQNIGAYGVELGEFLEAVHGVYLADGRPFSLSAGECQLSYRDSIFKGELRDKAVITSIDLRLSRVPEPRADYPALASYLHDLGVQLPTPEQIFDAVVDIRRSKLPDPEVSPNVGSFFKNPVLPEDQALALAERFPALPEFPHSDGQRKLAAAWMIDHCGWKGQRRGQVGVHPEHALVLVNYGADDGAELLALARDIAASVYASFGVELEIEPRVYGHE